MNSEYYLMIKEVEAEGKILKYLCKCIDWKDPYNYKGSGVYWRRFLKKYNLTAKDIKTTIIGKFDKQQLREQGEYYSKKFNVTDNVMWANLCDEIGDGGSTVYKRKRIYNPSNNQMKFLNETDELPAGWEYGGPKWKKDPNSVKKSAQFHKGKKRSAETREKMRNAERKKRITVPCPICNKQITKQNIKRHTIKCK